MINVLITGANGDIGQRLIQVLLQGLHQLCCCVRNKLRFEAEQQNNDFHVAEMEFLEA
jgi:thioester reductase-like protein